ncbi:beta-hexosaminidase subunit alpha-like isoform X1 [Macrobrachium nipponense]|uniref:beta-hexosaminidase subunit alpha-like isoform X1 n=1 Tax=Macrobrachium nipponense TaxID=159736 RepID=UPI0030C7FF7F
MAQAHRGADELQLAVQLVAMTVVWAGGYPDIIPTAGEIWPRPQEVKQGHTSMVVDPLDFRFVVTDYDCDILQQALERYLKIIANYPSNVQPQGDGKGGNLKSCLNSVQVSLVSACEEYPHQGMEESYEIKVNSSGIRSNAIIASQSIWGILRGLESFSQLLVPVGSVYTLASTTIKDYPRFCYRGLMIDTARHYIPVRRIEEMLDLLAMNKFNVLHWHLVDDQSFPYQSEKFPDLSDKGSYSKAHIYTAKDIADVIEYARVRGIRIIPEFDTPEHMKSWGPGQPNLLTPCYADDKPDGTYGPIDPTNEQNYEFLKSFLTEVDSRFPDNHIHLGGDAALAGSKCWRSNPNITKFMEKLGISEKYNKLRALYTKRLFDIVWELPNTDGFLVWEEVFDRGIDLPDNVIVQVWILHYLDVWKRSLQQITSVGFQTIMSSCWYLSDTIGHNWRRYYACDPRDFEGTPEQKELVLGGEACVWGEHVDATNIIPTAWPNACAVGERLWSSTEHTSDPEDAAPRLEEHRCRLLRRGYGVSPIFSSYCDADTSF